MKVPALVSSFILAAAFIGAVGARPQQPATPGRLPETQLRPTPSEVEIYKHAQTLIDWTPRQIHDCPFLHNLRPVGSQDQLPPVLERAGQAVTRMVQDFPQIAFDEDVDSEVHFARSHTTQTYRFRYIVLPHPVGDYPAFEEYRTDRRGNPLDVAGLGGRGMITSNYTSTCLYLSPLDQPENRFRHLGTQTIRKRECQVVGFAQRPEGARRVSECFMEGKRGVVLLQGLAWIDAETFQVLRIKTWLLAPRGDIGLGSHESTIDFYPVQPGEAERVIWLPRDVTVVVVYRGKTYRNIHHYSNYKLFQVDVTTKPAG